jgi:hypothetical protein
MAVRVLWVLAAFTFLYGCGQANSPVEKQEKQEGVEQAGEGEEPKTVTPHPAAEPTTAQAVGNIPISGVVGENIQTSSFDLRVLDYFVTDHYYYLTDLTFESMQEDQFSQLGKFVVVNYSLTNTSPQTISPAPIAQLHARAGGKVEVYDQSSEISPPHRLGGPQLALDDIPPRGMVVSQFIFDVPTDVEPELLTVTDEPTIYSSLDVGAVDLREDDPQGPRPEEILALQYEYTNMTAWEQAYGLFAQKSKERVPLEQYVKRNEEDVASAITEYSFPSVKVQGDKATIERVFSWETEDDEGQYKATQEAVLEDEGWRIVMRDEQYKYFGG